MDSFNRFILGSLLINLQHTNDPLAKLDFQHKSTAHTLTPEHQPHLSEGAFDGGEFVDNPERDAHHGGEGQQPAQGVSPPRVHVLLVVGQRGVFDQRKQEGCLAR